MTKAAITTIGAALLAAAALALSGCSYPGDDEDRAAFHAEAQDPVPSAPATEPTEPETPAEETGDEAVKSSWSEVVNQYQRRSDLIPNLVAIVSQAAGHENSTLKAVIEF